MDAQREGRQTDTRRDCACYLLVLPQKFRQEILELPAQNLYTLQNNFALAKNGAGGGVSNQLEKDRRDNRERMSNFLQNKDEERDEKDSLVSQQALERLYITQESNHADHAEIYR